MSSNNPSPEITAIINIEQKIFIVRGQKVMLDKDLAELYKVKTKALTQAVKRNSSRFPEDFMFQLKEDEYLNLRSQIVTSSWGGSRYLPYVFTELGVGMLSSVLKSDRAVQMNIFIIRAFAKLREMLSTHTELSLKFEKMEREQKKQSADLDKVYTLIQKFIHKPLKTTSKIGFTEKP